MGRTGVLLGQFGSEMFKVEGQGNTAQISCLDAHNKKFTASIKVYRPSTIKLKEEFNRAGKSQRLVSLYHTWHHIEVDNLDIIYSDEVEQGFILYKNPGFTFEMLQPVHLCALDYFKEISFVEAISDAYSLDGFRQIFGMTDQKLALFCKHHYGIYALKRYGFRIDELVILSYDKLSNLFEHIGSLDDALKYIKREQIIGTDHSPLALPERNLVINNRTVIPSPGVKEYESMDSTKITCTTALNKMTIQYHHLVGSKSLVAEIVIHDLNDESKRDLDKRFEGEPPETLLHDWWVTSTKGNTRVNRTYYCSSIPELMKITADRELPFNQITPLLESYQYFAEKQFVAFMRQCRLPIDEARQTEGFSQLKLELLHHHQKSVEFFMRKGLSIRDFGKIEEHRLDYVLRNQNESAKALKFVSVHELFGLPKPRPILRQYEGQTAVINLPEPEQEEENDLIDNCNVM